MKRSRGFTVVELVVVIVLLTVAGLVFFSQKSNIESARRDEHRKTTINAIYYSLEEAFYKQNKYYPPTLDAATLPTMDPELLTDPDGVMIGEANSDYHYEPTACVDNKCASYTLRASLENEADFVKSSRQAD